MEQEYIQKLQDVGLNEKQARAYLALLVLGRGSAASVAQKSGLKAPTTYVILKELIQKGFVRRVPKAKKQLFVPESPENALSSIEERVKDFKSILPELDSLTKREKQQKTQTLFFEGISGMKKAYAYRVDQYKNIEHLSYFASAEEISKELEVILLDWSKSLADRGVSSRAIAPDHPSLSKWRDKDIEFKRTVRVVPTEEYSAKSSIDIFPDFVRISLFGRLQCTIIEDKEFADAYRQIFEMNWNYLSPK